MNTTFSFTLQRRILWLTLSQFYVGKHQRNCWRGYGCGYASVTKLRCPLQAVGSSWKVSRKTRIRQQGRGTNKDYRIYLGVCRHNYDGENMRGMGPTPRTNGGVKCFNEITGTEEIDLLREELRNDFGSLMDAIQMIVDKVCGQQVFREPIRTPLKNNFRNSGVGLKHPLFLPVLILNCCLWITRPSLRLPLVS